MSTDTTLDAEQMQLRLLRDKPPSERLGLALRLTSDVIRASKRAIARAHPELTNREVGYRFIELHYGRELAEATRRRHGIMTSPSELVRALGPVVDELERLGVRHYIGGSVASSIHGAARSTLDVDVVSELDEAAALRLFGSLNDEYYISREAVLDAVRRRGCFNLIHLATSFKVDLFVSKGRDFDRCVQDRAVGEIIGDDGSLSVPVATAEDTILLKLEWYRLGNETSERQWNDVSLVAKLQGNRLDHEYLSRWADKLGVADLLARLTSSSRD